MQQVQRLDVSTTPSAASTTPVRMFCRHWLTGRRGLILGGLALVALGFALGWNWLTAIGVAPIIVSLAPCAAMCALGTCAMMRGRAAAAKPETVAQANLSTAERGGEQQSGSAG